MPGLPALLFARLEINPDDSAESTCDEAKENHRYRHRRKGKAAGSNTGTDKEHQKIENTDNRTP